MLEELKKYKIIKKSKYELAVDKALEDVNQRLWHNNGYYDIFYLGAVNQLQVIAEYLKKSDFIGRDEIRILLNGYKTIDEVSDKIKDLVDAVLEDLDHKED